MTRLFKLSLAVAALLWAAVLLFVGYVTRD